MKLKFSYTPQKSMWFKRIVSKGLILGLLFNNIDYSFANNKSLDERYENFKGDNIRINNILEEDKVNIEIEGNTLVNIHEKHKYFFNTEDIDKGKYEQISSENSVKVTFNERLNGWKYLNLGYLNMDMIKPNTTYTIYFEKVTGVDWIAFCNESYSGHISTEGKIKVVNNKVVITTTNFSREDLSSGMVLYGFTNADVGTTTEVTNAMIIEGNLEYESLNYFEGMKSVGELEENSFKIVSKNKNMLNLLDLKLGKKQYVTVENLKPNSLKLIVPPENTVKYASVFFDGMSFIPGKTYRVTGKVTKVRGETFVPFFSVRTSDFNIPLTDIMVDSNGNIDGIFVATEKTHRIEFFSGNHKGVLDDGEILFTDFQITEGSNLLDFEESLQEIKNIYLSEPLRLLPDGTKDRIIKKDGKYMVERNVGKDILDGSEDWVYEFENDLNYGVYCFSKGAHHPTVQVSDRFICHGVVNNAENVGFGTTGARYIKLFIPKKYLETVDVNGTKKFLSKNNINILFKLNTPIYEEIDINPVTNLYSGITYISSNSTIPLNMVFTVDRVANRAQESIEIAEVNPTIENISQARYWTNLMKESILKDAFQNEINTNTYIEDLTIEKKTTTANIDVYIKSKNGLSMTLSTNSIIFDEFGGTEDMEKLNAVEVTVDSSLPYNLNSYLISEIQNENGTNIIPKELFNIKINGENDYKAFANINEKLVLKEDCPRGENRYGIDLILKGSLTHEADVYKTTIKFEAEQK